MGHWCNSVIGTGATLKPQKSVMKTRIKFSLLASVILTSGFLRKALRLNRQFV
jgi:hypothetical protein